jgi:hypothetical protein
MIASNMANETNVPTPKPTTLEGWVKLLDDVRCPFRKASHDRVCRPSATSQLAARHRRTDAGQPGLALSVMREANRHTHGSLAEPAENLEVAINRLGLKRTEELLARLPVCRKDPQSPAPIADDQPARHATGQRFFASRLARLWQDIHWGSLLFLSPLWPLALTPQLLEDWELRVIHKGESARKVEKQLFGVRLLDIARPWRTSGTCRSGCSRATAAAQRAARTGEGAAHRPRQRASTAPAEPPR